MELVDLKNKLDRERSTVKETVSLPRQAHDVLQMLASALERAGSPHRFSDAVDFATYWLTLEAIRQLAIRQLGGQRKWDVKRQRSVALKFLRDPEALLDYRDLINEAIREFLGVPNGNRNTKQLVLP